MPFRALGCLLPPVLLRGHLGQLRGVVGGVGGSLLVRGEKVREACSDHALGDGGGDGATGGDGARGGAGGDYAGDRRVDCGGMG